jgi:hypothetical protein
MPEQNYALVSWLKGNAIATLVLAVSVIGSCGAGIWSVSRWVNAFENRISVTQTSLLTASRDVATLQGNVVSLDDRVNKLGARVLELHTLADQATRDLKARLDTIDALARFNTERSFQTPLPQGSRR